VNVTHDTNYVDGCWKVQDILKIIAFVQY